MPIRSAIPKYRKHRASGQAIVTLSGRDFYLGPYGTKTSRNEYDRLVGEWIANGRTLQKPGESITVVELVAAYVRWAKTYYVKDGQPTDTVSSIRNATRPLIDLYGRTMASDFGPLSLQAVISKMIGLDWSRTYINDCANRIRAVFKWGAAHEMVPARVFEALKSVSGLSKGRCTARETEPVRPVDDATIEATLPHLSPVVADMVRLQRLTGMRPGEVCQVRPCDIDTDGEVWAFRPKRHKTEHKDKIRIVAIGTQGQDVLRPYLLRPADSYCFSPKDAERKRRQAQHEARTTPLSCGNRPGTNRKRNPKQTIGGCYTSDSYRRAIERACLKAFPAPEGLSDSERKTWERKHRWKPNQIRHLVATIIRKDYGLEGAQVLLGHSNADTTQIYAERDFSKAVEIAKRIG